MAIQKVTDGPLAGFTMVDIDWEKFEDFVKRCCEAVAAGTLTYVFGGKDPRPGSGEIDFTGIDCSGFVRTVLDYATNGATSQMPDGSWMQGQWFGQRGFKRTYYANCALTDNLLRVAIHTPGGRGGDPTGHIWLVVNAHSVESYGGHGPGERPWNHPWFVEHIDECFVLG